jgi:uncharacterized membrane protein
MAETDQLHRLEDLLGRVLVTGVVASASILAVGLIAELAGANGHPVLRLGLILLMATPILRVVVSLVEYTRMRDWFFVATTGAVLIVLVTSILLAVL